MGGSASNVQPFCQPQNGAKFYVDVPYYSMLAAARSHDNDTDTRQSHGTTRHSAPT
jgi:hypothetical protein